MPPAEPTGQHELAAALGVELDAALLRQSLTHRSWAYEHPGQPHNERLEFLGDSVLGVVVTETLYRQHPDLSEGRLAKLRASVVNMRALADVAREIGPQGLGAYIWLGRGEQRTGGRGKASILADTTEAIIGAIYLQHGLDASARVIHDLFDELLHAVATNNAGVDWKTALQEYTAAHGLGVPDYIMSSVGPDHEKLFTARASVQGARYAACTGNSKKEAEQGAAQAAWRALSGHVDIVDDADEQPLATTAAAPPDADPDSAAGAG